MYHVYLSFQCIYEWSDEGVEDGDGKEGSELYGGWERVKVAWPLVKIERDRIAKRVYVGECAGNRSVGRSRKRWIDTVKECLRKKGLDVRQARRMVQDRSAWRRFVRGNAWGVSGG